jgi:hypothetical protein
VTPAWRPIVASLRRVRYDSVHDASSDAGDHLGTPLVDLDGR